MKSLFVAIALFVPAVAFGNTPKAKKAEHKMEKTAAAEHIFTLNGVTAENAPMIEAEVKKITKAEKVSVAAETGKLTVTGGNVTDIAKALPTGVTIKN